MNRPDPIGPPLLEAEWRWLAMLSYEIDPRILVPLVPRGTELDDWNGRSFVSVIGFRFLETRLRGWSIPFHRNFEEVNLRFYVRRRAEEGWRRGVVFVRELVPRIMVAWAARLLYNERYSSAPMGHRIEQGASGPEVSYWWRFGSERGEIRLAAREPPEPLREATEAEFIAEHYWGYSRRRDGRTLEYRVDHPRWRVWPAYRTELKCNVARIYGPDFVTALASPPASAFLAEGSEVSVYPGRVLER